MPSNIFLIRHGQSTFNAIFDRTGIDPMHFDAPLSERGKAQISGARRQLSGLPCPDIIISSPLTRALQTAVGLFQDCNVEIEVVDLHHERLQNSCDVGRSPKILADEFPTLRFDQLDDPWWHCGIADARGIAIEPLSAFTDRVKKFDAWLRDQNCQTVMVVGHAGFFEQLTGRRLENCEIFPWQ